MRVAPVDQAAALLAQVPFRLTPLDGDRHLERLALAVLARLGAEHQKSRGSPFARTGTSQGSAGRRSSTAPTPRPTDFRDHHPAAAEQGELEQRPPPGRQAAADMREAVPGEQRGV
jgi:hypothetical protein